MMLRSIGLTMLVLIWDSESQAATCERLDALSLPNTTITLAQLVDAGAFVPPPVAAQGPKPSTIFRELPAFCRVAATLRPTKDSDIKVEVWMPLVGWNGKFQGVGNGGFAGVITYAGGHGGVERGMAEALRRGYATASTDTGHTADTGSAFLGRVDALVDWGHRAVHEMTVAAKAIIAAFYERRPTRSYWNGCSTGGRQGLVEAQWA